MKYRKLPVIIEAFRYGCDQNPEWFFDNKYIICHPNFCMIKTLEGVMRADIGDYIIKGIQGELYPCKAEIFEATYEVVAYE